MKLINLLESNDISKGLELVFHIQQVLSPFDFELEEDSYNHTIAATPDHPNKTYLYFLNCRRGEFKVVVECFVFEDDPSIHVKLLADAKRSALGAMTLVMKNEQDVYTHERSLVANVTSLFVQHELKKNNILQGTIDVIIDTRPSNSIMNEPEFQLVVAKDKLRIYKCKKPHLDEFVRRQMVKDLAKVHTVQNLVDGTCILLGEIK